MLIYCSTPQIPDVTRPRTLGFACLRSELFVLKTFDRPTRFFARAVDTHHQLTKVWVQEFQRRRNLSGKA